MSDELREKLEAIIDNLDEKGRAELYFFIKGYQASDIN